MMVFPKGATGRTEFTLVFTAGGRKADGQVSIYADPTDPWPAALTNYLGN